MPLTEQEKIFVAEYQIDFDSKRAAAAAGYKRPMTTGRKLSKREDILSQVQRDVDARVEELSYTADNVLVDLLRVLNLDIADIIDNNGSVLEVQHWPEDWRKFVSTFEVTELSTKTEVTGFLSKFKIPDKLRTLELIGRHVGVQAWKDNSNLNITGSGIDELHKKRIESGPES